MKISLAPFFFASTLLVLAACAGAQPARISGTVTYLPRIALLPNAQVRVQLLDISLADAPAALIAEDVMVTSQQQVPLPFVIEYDPAAIIESHTYALQAEIRDAEGNLLFINTSATLVLTNGNPMDDIEIILDQVAN